MTEKEYNAAEGVRRSDLWKMSDSPEKFKWALENPEEQTAAMAFGSACHKFILEPDDWRSEYAIAPQGDRRTKECKAEWERFAEVLGDRTPVTVKDFAVMDGMADAIKRHELAAEMLTGQHEVPIFWTDPETGEKCKAKTDTLKEMDGKYAVVDYKTAADARTEVFNNALYKLGYHVQAAMYTEGVQNAFGLDYRPRFYFVVQEKKEPYAVNVIEVSDETMKFGDQVYHELLGMYHDCKTADIWPGYCDDVPNETTLPGWLGLEMDEE